MNFNYSKHKRKTLTRKFKYACGLYDQIVACYKAFCDKSIRNLCPKCILGTTYKKAQKERFFYTHAQHQKYMEKITKVILDTPNFLTLIKRLQQISDVYLCGLHIKQFLFFNKSNFREIDMFVVTKERIEWTKEDRCNFNIQTKVNNQHLVIIGFYTINIFTISSVKQMRIEACKWWMDWLIVNFTKNQYRAEYYNDALKNKRNTAFRNSTCNDKYITNNNERELFNKKILYLMGE